MITSLPLNIFSYIFNEVFFGSTYISLEKVRNNNNKKKNMGTFKLKSVQINQVGITPNLLVNKHQKEIPGCRRKLGRKEIAMSLKSSIRNVNDERRGDNVIAEDDKKYVEVLREVQPYILFHRGSTFVVVLSGEIVDSPFLDNLLQLQQSLSLIGCLERKKEKRKKKLMAATKLRPWIYLQFHGVTSSSCPTRPNIHIIRYQQDISGTGWRKLRVENGSMRCINGERIGDNVIAEDDRKYVEVLREVQPYILLHRRSTFVVVLSGEVVDSPFLDNLLQVYQSDNYGPPNACAFCFLQKTEFQYAPSLHIFGIGTHLVEHNI
ncbi:uncharacterized protein LOC112535735 [Ricinus communis]|uniref:uncharacterized protein LOC112535735 n=1 Tax=Ricinus communis TaxID=3988 RepID=UPI000D687368|nr:uncharacterized protein LOC112535735 [Ricinus communis]|eukprot:XP_025014235.1 uncharacterized protein LOC112535735 [Ricinus communis]